jgi:Tfp pilus assembly protein PilE
MRDHSKQLEEFFMKHNFKRVAKHQDGITLVEVAIGLAIGAVILATAFAGFQANARRTEVQQNSQLISEMVADAKSLFGQTNRYSQLSTGAAIAARVIPVNNHVDGETAINSYGGAIELAPATAGSNDMAMLTFNNVPKNQCADLAMSVERSVAGIAIGVTPVKNWTETNPDMTTFVLSVTDACSDDENNLVLYFKRA